MVVKVLFASLVVALILFLVYLLVVTVAKMVIKVRAYLDEDRQQAYDSRIAAEDAIDRLDRKIKLYEGIN